jgi:hypothetical protein
VISPLRTFVAVFSAACLFVQTVSATTVVPPTFRQLVAQAELIVRAEVRAVRCEETQRNGGSVIHTYVKIGVLRALKGDAPAELELRILGGTVGDRTLHVAGVPRFVPGEKCLLFIENNGEQFCPLVAIMYGRYRVERRASDGVEMVRRDNGAPLRTAEEVSLPLHAALPALASGAAQNGAGLTLAEFDNSISAELAAHATPTNQ